MTKQQTKSEGWEKFCEIFPALTYFDGTNDMGSHFDAQREVYEYLESEKQKSFWDGYLRGYENGKKECFREVRESVANLENNREYGYDPALRVTRELRQKLQSLLKK